MDDVERFDELVGTRLANISQELRTRLIMILGPTRRLLRDTNLTTAQRTDLKTVFRNGNELLDLVNDLVRNAQRSAEEVPLQRQPLTIPPLSTIEQCNSAASCGTTLPPATSQSRSGSGADGR